MDVTIRRSGVLLYTILQDHFPASLFLLEATFSRLVKQKVSRGFVSDIPYLEESDITPPKKKNGRFIMSPPVKKQRSTIAQRYGRYQRTRTPPGTINAKASQNLTKLEGNDKAAMAVASTSVPSTEQ